MTITLATDIVAFASARKPAQSRGEDALRGSVRRALRARQREDKEWFSGLLNAAERLLRRTYRAEAQRQSSADLRNAVAQFRDELTAMLKKTTNPNDLVIDDRINSMTSSVTNAAINAGYLAAAKDEDSPDGLVKVWISMEDDRVRATHRDAHGQRVPLDQPFNVGGTRMDRPGDVGAPIEEVINCRCILAIDRASSASAVASGAWTSEKSSSARPSEPRTDVSYGQGHSLSRATAVTRHEPSAPPWPTESRGSSPTVTSPSRPSTTFVTTTTSPAPVDPSVSIADASRSVTWPTSPSPSRHETSAPTGQQRPTVRKVIPTMTRTLDGQLVEMGADFDSAVSASESGHTESVERKKMSTVALAGGRSGVSESATPASQTAPPAVDPTMVDDPMMDDDITTPWHGVLAPENVASGDGRMFTPNALTWRDLPLPLAYQKQNMGGHDGSVVVGRIDEIWREEGLIKASGMFVTSPEADEAIGMLADRAIRGVSVDVDSAVGEMRAADWGEYVEGDESSNMAFTEGRISGATLCAIPAFQEAFVSIGDWPTDQQKALVASCACEAAIDEGKWDGSAGNYTDEQWYRATLIHLGDGPDKLVKGNNKLPILTPTGSMSRAGVHAAAGRIDATDAPPESISSAKAALRSAYKTLGEEPPANLAATAQEVEAFAAELQGIMESFAPGTEDGPGWLTHPVDTNRLRNYWTKGAGAAKIGWGIPGDFNRCRSLLAKYIKPNYLAGYCANRHKDALGIWPGMESGGRHHHSADMAPAFTLTASGVPVTESRFFEDPGFPGPTAISIDDEGRITGHLATWDVCHIGMSNTCITAPHSVKDYAYFRTGAVKTERGTVSVGTVTMDTGHASPTLGSNATLSHYDNTGTAAADVAVGEDAYGIWLSGKVRDDLPLPKRHALQAGALSGDWRRIGGALELVGALAVNVPGFPVPRPALAASAGEQVSLVAAGVLTVTPSANRDADLSAAVMAAIDEIEARAARKAMHKLAVSTGRDPKSKMERLALMSLASRGE